MHYAAGGIEHCAISREFQDKREAPLRVEHADGDVAVLREPVLKSDNALGFAIPREKIGDGHVVWREHADGGDNPIIERDHIQTAVLALPEIPLDQDSLSTQLLL
jgi:hypothetical protein